MLLIAVDLADVFPPAIEQRIVVVDALRWFRPIYIVDIGGFGAEFSGDNAMAYI